MPNITEEKWIEMLEKKADGTYIAKYPKVKSKSGITFDEHLADNVSAHGGILKCVSGVASSLPIVVGFKPKFAFVVEMAGSTKAYYFLAETAPSTIIQIGSAGTEFAGAAFSNNGITNMYIKNKSAPLHYVIFG